MINKTVKITYGHKKVHFEENVLIDENGEVIDLVGDLVKVFGDREFDLTAAVTNKKDYEIGDFGSND